MCLCVIFVNVSVLIFVYVYVCECECLSVFVWYLECVSRLAFGHKVVGMLNLDFKHKHRILENRGTEKDTKILNKKELKVYS